MYNEHIAARPLMANLSKRRQDVLRSARTSMICIFEINQKIWQNVRHKSQLVLQVFRFPPEYSWEHFCFCCIIVQPGLNTFNLSKPPVWLASLESTFPELVFQLLAFHLPVILCAIIVTNCSPLTDGIPQPHRHYTGRNRQELTRNNCGAHASTSRTKLCDRFGLGLGFNAQKSPLVQLLSLWLVETVGIVEIALRRLRMRSSERTGLSFESSKLWMS